MLSAATANPALIILVNERLLFKSPLLLLLRVQQQIKLVEKAFLASLSERDDTIKQLKVQLSALQKQQEQERSDSAKEMSEAESKYNEELSKRDHTIKQLQLSALQNQQQQPAAVANDDDSWIEVQQEEDCALAPTAADEGTISSLKKEVEELRELLIYTAQTAENSAEKLTKATADLAAAKLLKTNLLATRNRQFCSNSYNNMRWRTTINRGSIWRKRFKRK